MEALSVSLIQADLAWQDKEKNLRNFEEQFSKIEQVPDLIVLPEMFNTGFVVEPHAIAENPGGMGMQWLAKQSARLGCVICGSLVITEDGEFFNRLIWMRPDGSHEKYDKRHLFRLGNEHLQFSAGNSKLIVELKGWKICPLVCYDLRFPVWSKNTCNEGEYEYDLLIYMANWPGSRSYAFRQLLIARAIENQSYLIGVNRIGEDGKGVKYQGDSTIIDFKGEHLKSASLNQSEIISQTLDYEELSKFRKSFAFGMDWDRFKIL